MNISDFLSLEFLFVILSVIFVLSIPKILITIARKSKVGFIISVVITCLILVCIVIYFTVAYNDRYSLEGQHYVYGRITTILPENQFVINSTKGTYESGTIGNLKVIIDRDTKVYSNNFFENIKTVESGDFVTIVCKDEQIKDKTVHAIRVIRNNKTNKKN